MLKHFCTKLLAKETTGHPTQSMKVLHQNQVLAKLKGSCLRSCTLYLSLIVVLLLLPWSPGPCYLPVLVQMFL